MGMEAIFTDGWQVPPHYDIQSKRLEWGTRLKTGAGNLIVNYTSRLLGRSGVMSAILVSDPGNLAADTQQFKAALQQFTYIPGENYAEFKAGDKVAEYGLAALVLGGAAAIATKKGLWAVIGGFLAAFWKIIAGVAVAGLAGISIDIQTQEAVMMLQAGSITDGVCHRLVPLRFGADALLQRRNTNAKRPGRLGRQLRIEPGSPEGDGSIPSTPASSSSATIPSVVAISMQCQGRGRQMDNS